MQELDYEPMMTALKLADQDFTEAHGITHHSIFDDMLEQTTRDYNQEHGTSFDPFEAKHRYLEMCEAEPNPYLGSHNIKTASESLGRL